MELPLSRKPVERAGDDYKRMKAAMARRLRGKWRMKCPLYGPSAIIAAWQKEMGLLIR